jgi:peroxiredoxin
MTLTSRLKSILASRPARSQSIHEDTIDRLKQAEIVDHALKVGDVAPAFMLPNAEGQLVASEDLLAAGPLVVSFFRGGWCPYCNLTLREMETALPDIQGAGARFVAIWPETGGHALSVKRAHGLSYDLLVDVDNAVAMQFGIVFRLPDLYREALLGGGVDLATRHGNPAWLLPLTATYVIAPNGLIGYAYVDGDFTTRAEPDDIVGFLISLRR